MGIIINIDQALLQRSEYNVLREPLNEMLKRRQEEWEKKNPIDMLFKRGTINSFQETFVSNIGFDHAFEETGDYGVSTIFNTEEGFSATYRTRTFQGGFIITQQTLEDGQHGKIKDNATRFITRWHGDIVEYAMTAIDSGFGVEREFGTGNNKSRLKLLSADTTDGDIRTETRNPLFCKTHKTVKREGGSAISQSNFFYANVDILGDDPARIPKLADAINQAITVMENYRDDNGKLAGVDGTKHIVIPNDPHLKSAIKTALSMEKFQQGESLFENPAYERAVLEYTPYLNDIEACKKDDTKHVAKGFFIVDPEYNAGNHGPELTERIALTMNAIESKDPYGIKYAARQRFDVNVAAWRGIAYVYIGTPSATETDWNYSGKMTELTPAETVVMPVSITNSSINTNATVSGSISNTPTT